MIKGKPTARMSEPVSADGKNHITCAHKSCKADRKRQTLWFAMSQFGKKHIDSQLCGMNESHPMEQDLFC